MKQRFKIFGKDLFLIGFRLDKMKIEITKLKIKVLDLLKRTISLNLNFCQQIMGNSILFL